MNINALAVGLGIEQPPSSLPIEAQEYLNRVMIQISGQLENLSASIIKLEKRVEDLETP